MTLTAETCAISHFDEHSILYLSYEFTVNLQCICMNLLRSLMNYLLSVFLLSFVQACIEMLKSLFLELHDCMHN